MLKKLLCLDNKTFYKSVFSIAIPIMLQNLINFGVSMMDTLMVGTLGDVGLSASSAANNWNFMFFLISFGVASGCGVLTAQYWGAGDRERVVKVIGLLYRIVMVVALFFALCGMLFPEAIMKLFVPEPEVISEGAKYLRIISVGFFFAAITNSTIGILRSVGTVKISVVVYSVSLLVNTFFNYLLIFGKFGFPRLGIEGAAIATVISRIAEAVIIVVFMLKYDKKLGFRLHDLLHVEKDIVRLSVKYSLPVVLNEFIWGLGNMTVCAIIGHLGKEALSANSICSVLFQLAQSAMFGLSSSAGALTGQTVGAGDYEGAQTKAKAFIVMSIILGFAGSGIMFIARYPLIAFYKASLSSMAIEYAYSMSAVASVLAVVQTVSSITMMGILRGGGDTKFVMLCDVIFMYTISIPLGFVAGFYLKLPVYVVYLLLKSDDIIKSGIAALRIKSGVWLKDITQNS